MGDSFPEGVRKRCLTSTSWREHSRNYLCRCCDSAWCLQHLSSLLTEEGKQHSGFYPVTPFKMASFGNLTPQIAWWNKLTGCRWFRINILIWFRLFVNQSHSISTTQEIIFFCIYLYYIICFQCKFFSVFFFPHCLHLNLLVPMSL